MNHIVAFMKKKGIRKLNVVVIDGVDRIGRTENEQNFQYHLSYQIRCKTKHMHDSVNVLLYKQYLKKEKG